MIVKNESHVIEKTLAMLVEKLPVTYWAISDTGSTDGTQDVIRKFFADRGIPGELVEHEWRDFGWNRTKSLEAGYNKTDYLLIFDADDWIHGNLVLPKLPPIPAGTAEAPVDMFHLKFGPGMVYKRPLLINNRLHWRFVGVLHEFLAGGRPGGNREQTIEGDYYVESGKTGDRSKDPQKYDKDASVLERGYKEEPDSALRDRYAFYCAQSYMDGRRPDKSIEWYKKVIEVGSNWAQEKYYACLMIAGQTKDQEEAIKYYDMAQRFDPERKEHIRRLTEIYSNKGYHMLVNALYRRVRGQPPINISDKLFVAQWDYANMMEWYNSISAFYVNDIETGYESCKKIITEDINVKEIVHATMRNLGFYKSEFDKDSGRLDFFWKVNKKINPEEAIHIDIWKYMYERTKPELATYSLMPKVRPQKVKIMLSMTTCKRYDLFEQTVNSILNQWTDVDRIDYWFCVDDNSSAKDRKLMQTKYPFFDYYLKGPAEKGHIASMNVIWNKLNHLRPTYWIHLEDDFLFFDKMDYITKAIDGLDKMKGLNVKQVLFNRAYAETIDDYRIRSYKALPEDHPAYPDYCMQDYRPGESFPYPNSHYWPHYSFRPSLIEVSAILDIGNYDCVDKFFEMEYAMKWYNKGFRSAFFNKVTCVHTGRLTSERHTPNEAAKNAYDLNGVDEFNGRIHSVEEKPYIKVVNLDRRVDRRQKMTDLLRDANIQSYEFVRAVDGKALQPTEELHELFNGNDFGSRRGFIGCALTHYNLWKRLTEDNDHDFYLVLEDDIEINEPFKSKSKFKKTIEQYKEDMLQKELIMFGYSMFTSDRNNLPDNREPGIYPLDFNRYIGGTFGYSINKKGAAGLLDYIAKNGIKHGIDYVMKLCHGDYYEMSPELVVTEWNESGKTIDSDIQNLYDTIDLNAFVSFKDQFTFVPGLDQPSNDIYYYRGSLSEMMKIALDNPAVACFNTLGFFKSKAVMSEFATTPYFRSTTDGTYIKKQALAAGSIGDILVRPICNWTNSEGLCREWDKLTKGNGTWNALRLTWDDQADYYAIINKPCNSTDKYDPARTVVFQMEPWCDQDWQKWGVKTWGEWARPDAGKFMEVRSHENTYNNGVWEFELKYPDLANLNPEKTKGNVISSICSSKYFDPGHIKRIDFLKFLESKEDPEVALHIYNYDNEHGFKSYVGRADAKVDKAKAIVPYKYYFMCENNQEKNFITEKIWESLLCEVLCFYWGCPNIEEWLDPRSYVQLDMDDFEGSYQIIKQAFRENWYEARLPIIKQEKERVLNYFSFMPTMERSINKHLLSKIPGGAKRVCFIYSCNKAPSGTVVLDTLLDSLSKSCLDLLDLVIIVNTGDKLKLKKAETDKIKIIEYSKLTNLYEPCCLRIMHQYSLDNPEASILYLHTKGINYFEDSAMFKRSTDWTKYMLYFLVEADPAACLNELESNNAYTIGCNYNETPVPHYSGNFWWATAKYISSLPVHKLTDKMSAERWLNPQGDRCKVLFNSCINHFTEEFPRERYVNTV